MKFINLQRYPALSSRDFAIQWSGQFISNAGTQMQIVALNWQLYEMTRSPYVLALLGASRVLPIIIFGLISGTIVDAHNRKKLLIVVQIIQALIAGMVTLITFNGSATVINLLVLNAIALAFYTIDAPARAALMPQLVPREHFSNAVSLNVIGYNISTVAGPAIAGFMIAYFGVTSVYALNTLSFLVLLGALLALHTSGAIEGPRHKASIKAIREGIAFVKSKPIIWSTMLLDFFSTFFAEATVLLPVFAKEILHVGPQLLGVLYAAPFVGATISGVIASHVGKYIHQGRVLLWSIIVYAIGTIVFGISTNYVLSTIALVVIGAGDGMSAVIRNVVRQMNTPDNFRGRMTSINMIFYTGGPRLGEVEAGLVAGLVGAPLSTVIGGFGTIIAVVFMAYTIPALRNYKQD